MAKKTYQFLKIADRNGHSIRGLYRRGKRFYGRMTNTDPISGLKKVQWVQLVGANDLSTAKSELGKMRALRDNHELVCSKEGPPFCEYVDHYLAATKLEKAVVPGKTAKTWENESSFLNNYVRTFKDRPLGRITTKEVIEHRTARLADGISRSTMKLQIIALRNLYKRAIVEGQSRSNPAALVTPLSHKAKEKYLITEEEIYEFSATARETLKRSGMQVSDWVLLMAYSGARPSEALSLKWTNVDFERGQLSFPAEIVKGGYRPRVVEFNPSLRKHLLDMSSRKSGETWIFPSPRPNRLGGRQETFDAEFRKVRESLAQRRNTEAEKQRMIALTAHFLRHFFVSVCCMSGVDMLTTTQWVGHKDSTLVREVYAHLDNSHRREQAEKLSFDRKQDG